MPKKSTVTVVYHLIPKMLYFSIVVVLSVFLIFHPGRVEYVPPSILNHLYLILAMILVLHGSSIMKLPPSVSVGMTWEALSSAMTKKVLKRMLSWIVTA